MTKTAHTRVESGWIAAVAEWLDAVASDSPGPRGWRPWAAAVASVLGPALLFGLRVGLRQAFGVGGTLLVLVAFLWVGLDPPEPHPEGPTPSEYG